MKPFRPVVAVCSLFVASCAGQAPTPDGPEPAEPEVPPSVLRGVVPVSETPDVLTGDEIRETRAGNLWDALRHLRPQWLRARGVSSVVGGANNPIVYLQGIRYGTVRALQNMNVDQVRRVEFIDPVVAGVRLGTGHGGGAIMVDLDR